MYELVCMSEECVSERVVVTVSDGAEPGTRGQEGDGCMPLWYRPNICPALQGCPAALSTDFGEGEHQ